MSAAPARCGAPTASGGVCRRKVSSEGERCAHHREAQAETTADPSANAITHGITSARAIVPGETPEAWAEHRAGILASLSPVGALEVELSDRVALLSWRLRRVVRYEAGAVAAAVERVERRKRTNHDWSEDAQHHADDWQRAADALEAARERRDKRRALDVDVTAYALSALVEKAGEITGELAPVAWPGVTRAELVADGWGDEPDDILAIECLPLCGAWTVARLVEAVEAVALAGGDDPAELVQRAIYHAKREAAERRLAARDGAADYAAALASALLPDASTLDKVTRYEAHLHRLMVATLRELEALQKLRTGQDAPLARLDVSTAA